SPIPPCLLVDCPDPLPDFLERAGKERANFLVEFGNPNPHPSVIPIESQLAAARSIKMAPTQALKIVDVEIERLEKPKK
ncbi:MAG: hypothetical protein ACREC6_11175, partial [Hyphomicrobiaceae bacterium]